MGDFQARQEETATTESTPAPAWLRWAETLALTALFVGAGAWNRPEDPFYITGGFSWPVLSPFLVGLRYGFFHALVSALLLLGALGVGYREGWIPSAEFPYAWAIGVLIFSLLAGEFRDYWGRRLEKLEASNRYRQVRLEEFTRNFYLLKVSHDRLEQQLAGSSSSLREALRRLYQEIAHARGHGLTPESGELMLQLLIRYGHLQIAAVYPVTGNTLGDKPVARIGAFEDVRRNDPLIQRALTEKKLVSVQNEYLQKLNHLNTDLLLALPLIDSRQTLLGMVVVQAMPFFNFQPRTLRLLAILAGHMADMIQEQLQVPDPGSAEWRQFRFQLLRADQDARQHSLPAALIRLTFARDQDAETVARQMRRLRRGLDVIAELPPSPQPRLAILLPLTDELGQTAYLQRLDDAVHEHNGKTLADLAEIRTLIVSDKGEAESWLTEIQEEPSP
ncbi:MAG: PelD GGDEF domain-containing protein [Pseudomonadota bacterium]|nr:PelD GGDEF domain-containing protein [Pseudomonadota bacterium]